MEHLHRHADVQWSDEAAACVVMASGGYPDPYQTGEIITGFEDADAIEGVNVFHAGTEQNGENIVTAGGRVLGVTAVADGLHNAIQRAYQGVSAIHFNKAHVRNDIGHRALEKS